MISVLPSYTYDEALWPCLSSKQPTKALLYWDEILTMLSSILRSSSVIWILASVFRFCLASGPVCLADIYGVPNYRDCMQARLSMPFARDPGGRSYPRRPELFSEPQYLLPPFTRIHNRYQPRPISQLPKIWRYSTLVSNPPSNCVFHCFGALLLLRSVDGRVSRHMSSRTDE